MMQKIQKFGGAMFTPVLLFSFAGIMVGIGTLCTTEAVLGSLAAPTSMWYLIWNVILQGAWCVFNQLPLLFVIGLPIGLAMIANIKTLDMGMFGTLLVSVSGQNKKMVEAAKKLRIAGVNLMSITKNRENTLAHLCNFNLYVDESNHFETPMHWQYESTTAYFILIDILFLKYLEYHQRKEADHEA